MINWIASVIAPHILDRNFKNVCEIGSSTGAATDKILQLTSADVTIVDPCLDVNLIKKYQDNPRVNIAKGLSLDIIPTLQDRYDCILIDGDHNWYTVYNELRLIHNYGLLVPGGTIFFHDVGWPYGRRDMYYSLDAIPNEHVNSHTREGIVRGSSQTIPTHTWPHDIAISEGGPKNGVLTAIEDFYHEHRHDYGFFCCPSVEAGLGVLWKKDPGHSSYPYQKLRFKLARMSAGQFNISSAKQLVRKLISY